MPQAFFEPFCQNFSVLFKEYGFQVTSESYDPDGFGSGLLRLSSERYYLDFQVDGMGPEVTIHAGRVGQRAIDLAWIFAYLTRSANAVPAGSLTSAGSYMLAGSSALAGPAAWLYFFPHFHLSKWGENSVAWQAGRLADILQPIWPALFIFLDMDGPRSADFAAFQERANRTNAERAADGYRSPAEKLGERAALNFAAHAQKAFSFLTAYGFKVVQADPVLVRYESSEGQGRLGADAGMPPLYVNIFHRLVSWRMGVHTAPVQSDASFELDFDLEELSAWNSVPYQPISAHRPEEMQGSLNRLARAFRRCAAPILSGDPRLFDALLARRIDAARRASRTWAERNRRA